MIGWLETIWHVVASFGDLVAWGGITALNGVFHSMTLAGEFVFSQLPAMPDAPSLSEVPELTEIIRGANAIFPFGDFVSYLGTLVGLALTFYTWRYLLKVLRAL